MTNCIKATTLVGVAAMALGLSGCAQTGLVAHHTNPSDNSFWFTEVRDGGFMKTTTATLWHCRLAGPELDPVCKPAYLFECKGNCAIESDSLAADFGDHAVFDERPLGSGSGSSDGASSPAPPAAGAAARSSEESAADKSKVGF
jgi:hypothetical protein